MLPWKWKRHFTTLLCTCIIKMSKNMLKLLDRLELKAQYSCRVLLLYDKLDKFHDWQKLPKTLFTDDNSFWQICNLVVVLVLYHHHHHKIKSHFLPSLVTSRVPLRSKFKNVENLKNTDFDGIFKFPEFCFLSLVGHVKLLKRAKNDVRF